MGVDFRGNNTDDGEVQNDRESTSISPLQQKVMLEALMRDPNVRRQVEQAKIKRQQELEALAKKKRRHQRVSTKHSSPNDDPLEVKDDDDEPDWIQCFDEWTKRHYYYNVALLQFSYDIPEDPFISAAESSFYKATTTIQNHVRDHLEKRKSSTDTPVP